MNKHVLVIADFEDNDLLSLEKARDIAKDISASLEIIKFIQHNKHARISETEHINQAQVSLNKIVEQIFGPDQTHVDAKVVVSDHIDEWVVKRCDEQTPKVDLVIKGGHRTESLFHMPTDWKLVRHLHCPILIASHNKWKSKANILMTLDLGHDDARHQHLNNLTLDWGNTWAQATHTSLHAVYCIPIARPLLEFDIVDKHNVERKKAPAFKQKMAAILAQHDIANVTSHVHAGCTKKVLPHVASDLRADLVILGCFGHEGLNGFLQGNTAEKVMHHLRTDCLIVKPAQDM